MTPVKIIQWTDGSNSYLWTEPQIKWYHKPKPLSEYTQIVCVFSVRRKSVKELIIKRIRNLFYYRQ